MNSVCAACIHLVALVLVAATLVLVGQPIYANDTWIHLALGKVFAAQGPWLSSDPHLFAAPGPPSPSSWLGAVGFHAVYWTLGFAGLRAFHVLLAAGILALAWLVVRRASGSRAWASVGLIAFVLLSTYRLVQLRPHLFTIAAVLLLYLILIANGRRPGWKRITIAMGVACLWANVHAAFLLGPILVLGTSLSLIAASWLPGAAAVGAQRDRARGLALAGLGMTFATLLNPAGYAAHLSYFQAGGDTLALASVIDEWGRTNLLAWPARNLPPTPAAWAVCWLGLLGVIAGGLTFWSRLRDPERANRSSFDPALLALAVAGLAAALFATRFLWLAIFPVALLGSIWASHERGSERASAVFMGAGLVLSIGLGVAHAKLGDWPLVSKALLRPDADYTQPYRAEKYHAQVVWFLADTGVEGRIYNDYSLGGFLSFWLAPKIRMSSSGTMNVEREAMEAHLAIGARSSNRPEESFLEALDRQGIDLFFGTGLPIQPPPNKPIPSSTRYCEGEPDWLLVFRTARSALYLRRGERNRANLDRIAAYYARQGVPFDPARGFQTERVLIESPQWAIAHGLIPEDFAALVARARKSQAAGEVDASIRRLAIVYAITGLYDRAERVDRWILQRRPGDADATRRLLWSLLQARRFDEAAALRQTLAMDPAGKDPEMGDVDPLVGSLMPSPEVLAATVSRMPLLGPVQTQIAQYGLAPAEARSGRLE